ncbi:hypothetical protein ACIRP0_31605 [Streptomyces sp. NPDC101733]|uniref:hypothetical protein n=1 Tax=unclassified Streptomyces TaxID=2593676 RepID=UPI003813F426
MTTPATLLGREPGASWQSTEDEFAFPKPDPLPISTEGGRTPDRIRQVLAGFRPRRTPSDT